MFLITQRNCSIKVKLWKSTFLWRKRLRKLRYRRKIIEIRFTSYFWRFWVRWPLIFFSKKKGTILAAGGGNQWPTLQRYTLNILIRGILFTISSIKRKSSQSLTSISRPYFDHFLNILRTFLFYEYLWTNFIPFSERIWAILCRSEWIDFQPKIKKRNITRPILDPFIFTTW